MFKRVLLASMALALISAGGAIAGKNSGGSMLIHVDDAVLYSSGWDYCSTALGVTDCAGVVTRSERDNTAETMIWMLGVFDPTAHPGVTAFQFGIEHNLPTGYFTAWAPCPFGTALEIPDPTFPDASGTGTAVAFAVADTSHVMTLYWLAPTRGPDAGTTYFVGTGSYHPPEGAQFADDSNPAIVDVITNFGTMRWGADGDKACPTPPVLGACCLQGWFKCEVVLENACLADGGIYLGDGSICDAQNTCSACCYRDTQFRRWCSMVPEWYCLDHYSEQGSGGLYADPAWSGLKQDGTGNVCAPSADSAAVEWWCDVYGTRTQTTTWGKLKSLFR